MTSSACVRWPVLRLPDDPHARGNVGGCARSRFDHDRRLVREQLLRRAPDREAEPVRRRRRDLPPELDVRILRLTLRLGSGTLTRSQIRRFHVVLHTGLLDFVARCEPEEEADDQDHRG